MKWRRWSVGLLFGCLVSVLGFGWQMHRSGQRPVANAEDVVLEIGKGDRLGQIATRLRDQGIIADSRWFVALAYWRRAAGRLKFGEYLIPSGMRWDELLDLLVSGKVRQHSFTIIEGWNVRQVIAAVGTQPMLAHRLGDKSPDEILRALGYPTGSAEGRFFPDTYYFPKGFPDTELLRRATERMNAILDWEWQHRQPGLPLQSAYEALILASIVEKETARADERARIAGVFVRRLERRMRLQTDPAVIYGMGERYSGNIARQDLLQDTPYNTYTRSGLPPTPIAMPGAAALHAALHPEPGSSLYFVARGDGSHVFSDTLSEHERAVTLYQRGRRDP